MFNRNVLCLTVATSTSQVTLVVIDTFNRNVLCLTVATALP